MPAAPPALRGTRRPLRQQDVREIGDIAVHVGPDPVLSADGDSSSYATRAATSKRKLPDQMQQQLADEERVAAGLGGDRRNEGIRHLLVGHGLQQLLDFCAAQTSEPKMVVGGLARQHAERSGSGCWG